MQMRRFLPALVALVLAGCGGEPAPEEESEPAPDAIEASVSAAVAAERAALDSCGVVTPEGYCGVRFGMTPEAAAAAFPVKLENYETAPPAGIDPLRCFELFAVEPVTGVSLLVEGNSVDRIDFISATARTADGFGVGSSAAEIRKKFGSAVAETPNVYEPEITDLSVTQGEAKFVFEIEAGVVRSWRAGITPGVDYPAHCG